MADHNAPNNKSSDNFSITAFFDASQDEEALRYRLMHRLQQVNKNLEHQRLYPHYWSVRRDYNVLRAFKDNLDRFHDALPKTIKNLKADEFGFEYKDFFETFSEEKQRDPETDETFDAEILQGMERLVNWALPQLQESFFKGLKIYNTISEQVKLNLIGIEPAYQKEGYLLLEDRAHAKLHLYRYNFSGLARGTDDIFPGLGLEYLECRDEIFLKNDPIQIKRDLLDRYDDLPVPAVFLANSEMTLPHKETLKPMAQLMLINRLTH